MTAEQLAPCPVCGHTWQVPERQFAPALAAVFGISTAALAETHLSQEVHRLEGEIDRHMRQHTPQEWLPVLMAAIERADAAIAELSERRAES